MMASDAVRAPSTPPLTGQSRKPTPRASSWCGSSRAVPAPTVEQSMTIILGFNPARDPRSPRANPRRRKRRSPPLRSCRQVPPDSRRRCSAIPSASAAAFAAVRFHTPVSSPARLRLRAMCAPMAPNPTKPVCIRDSPLNYQRRSLRLCAAGRQSELQIDAANGRPAQVGRDTQARAIADRSRRRAWH
jgi:hypothetical protein